MEPESSLSHSQVPSTSPCTMCGKVCCPYVEGSICKTYGTFTWFALRSSLIVDLYKVESVQAVMGCILKAVSIRYMERILFHLTSMLYCGLL